MISMLPRTASCVRVSGEKASWQRHDRFDPGGTISLTPPDG